MAAPAATTAAQATSGGVAFLSRHDRPLQAAARHSPGDRIAAATCRFRGAHLLLCAVYLHTGIGPVGENLRVLAALGSILDNHAGPWLAMGDWNMTPSEFSGSGFVDRFSGRAIPPPGLMSTCTASGRTRGEGRLLDFTLASQDALRLVQSTSASFDEPWRPHAQIGVSLYCNLKQVMVEVPRAPPRLPEIVRPECRPLEWPVDLARAASLLHKGGWLRRIDQAGPTDQFAWRASIWAGAAALQHAARAGSSMSEQARMVPSMVSSTVKRVSLDSLKPSAFDPVTVLTARVAAAASRAHAIRAGPSGQSADCRASLWLCRESRCRCAPSGATSPRSFRGQRWRCTGYRTPRLFKVMIRWWARASTRSTPPPSRRLLSPAATSPSHGGPGCRALLLQAPPVPTLLSAGGRAKHLQPWIPPRRPRLLRLPARSGRALGTKGAWRLARP